MDTESHKPNFFRLMPLLRLDLARQGYYLGFDTKVHQPTETEVQDSLMQLSELGIDRYAEKIASSNREYFERVRANKVIFNQKDLNDQDWANYLPTDLFYTSRGDNVFIFSRNDFKKLSELKRNPYDASELPSSFMDLLKKKTEVKTVVESLTQILENNSQEPNAPNPKVKIENKKDSGKEFFSALFQSLGIKETNLNLEVNKIKENLDKLFGLGGKGQD